MNEKSVKENLSTMNLKEKCNYLFYYYKFYLIGFLIIVLAIGSFIYTEKNKKDIYLNIAYIGPSISAGIYENINNDLNSSLIPDDQSNSSIIEFNAYDLSHTAALTKFQASLAAKEIDFAIVDKGFFEENYKNELFLNLNSIDNFSSLNINDNSLIKINNVIYGIRVNNLSILNQLNILNNDDNILVVILNSKNSTKLIDLLKTCGIN